LYLFLTNYIVFFWKRFNISISLETPPNFSKLFFFFFLICFGTQGLARHYLFKFWLLNLKLSNFICLKSYNTKTLFLSLSRMSFIFLICQKFLIEQKMTSSSNRSSDITESSSSSKRTSPSPLEPESATASGDGADDDAPLSESLSPDNADLPPTTAQKRQVNRKPRQRMQKVNNLQIFTNSSMTTFYVRCKNLKTYSPNFSLKKFIFFMLIALQVFCCNHFAFLSSDIVFFSCMKFRFLSCQKKQKITSSSNRSSGTESSSSSKRTSPSPMEPESATASGDGADDDAPLSESLSPDNADLPPTTAQKRQVNRKPRQRMQKVNNLQFFTNSSMTTFYVRCKNLKTYSPNFSLKKFIFFMLIALQVFCCNHFAFLSSDIVFFSCMKFRFLSCQKKQKMTSSSNRSSDITESSSSSKRTSPSPLEPESATASGDGADDDAPLSESLSPDNADLPPTTAQKRQVNRKPRQRMQKVNNLQFFTNSSITTFYVPCKNLKTYSPNFPLKKFILFYAHYLDNGLNSGVWEFFDFCTKKFVLKS